jgi:hypothetical protein
MTRIYARRIERLLTYDGQDALVRFVAANPEAGDIVAGTGGVRKLRWGIGGQGKRGGLRVLHLYLRHKDTLWLVDVYAKHDKPDLSPKDVKDVRAWAEAIKRSYP